MSRPLLCVLCLICLIPSLRPLHAEAEQTAVTVTVQRPVTLRFLVALPEGYEDREKWPLILFLHGSGERGENIELVKKHGPPKRVTEGAKLPFVIVSPQLPRGEWWSPADLVALLDHVEATYKVDSTRVYATGLSLGGFGTWALARHAPHRLAAIAPICGGGETQRAERLKDVPVWAFHGDADRVVKPQKSIEMVEAVRKEGGTAKLTIYPDVDHDSWTQTYETPELYEWFLSHRKPERSTGAK